jgi:aldehyde dehydrogenase (NAD+)
MKRAAAPRAAIGPAPAADAVDVAAVAHMVFRRLGLRRRQPGVFDGRWRGSGAWIAQYTPIDGSLLGRVRAATAAETETAVSRAHAAFRQWREVPAPRRGEFVRRYGLALRAAHEDLARLVTLESGKILAEARGEVQEMIDICDFAVGLSRQLHGLTIASERPGHRLFEQWHPLGAIGVISAFNFPVAVWSWNAALAHVCGDAVVWKPSEKTPFTAVACTLLAERVARECEVDPAVATLVVGGAETGAQLAADRRLPLISATGSVRMGRAVATAVAQRLGRSLLELGGNNAVIVAPSADVELALRAIVFGAAGTAGQRCTTTRRLIVHESLRETLGRRLAQAYGQLRIGNPLDPRTLVGPLIDAAAVEAMTTALTRVRAAGGRVVQGGRVLTGPLYPGGGYVEPCLVAATPELDVLREETFAPILYVLTYRTFDEALALHNDVPHGLSSALFTTDLREAERFLAASGSDCGLANVNLGTSGAEIGGAFGGEKDTGGGRESGADAWKAYMRRQTCTINGTSDLPLAQGIRFGD